MKRLCLFLLVAATAAAQTKPFVIQGSVRSRLEAWNWFEPDSGDPSYIFNGTLARLAFSRTGGSFDWQLEFAAPLLLALPDNALGPGVQGQLGLGANYYAANDRSRNAVGFFPKQAWLRFKRGAHNMRLGRFEYLDGSEMTPKNATLAAVKRDRVNMRLLGHFGWAHVGRSFDGLHYSYNRPSGNLTFVGAVPTRGVFQTDGWGQTSSALGYAAYTRPWGARAHAAETRIFLLHYQDWREILKTDSRALAVRRADLSSIRIQTFGGHSLHALETRLGTIDLLLWAAAQSGRWGVQSHRAHAINIEGGFQTKAAPKLKPWLRLGFYDGSGDGDPADNTHGTFFQVLPTPRPFARFPFFNMMNNRDLFGMLILRPRAKITVSSEMHALRLSSRQDLWYAGGGVFQPWSFGYLGRAAGGARSLANLYDTSVEYRYRPDLSLTFYYGYAQGLAVTRAIYPKGKNGGLGYIEANFRF